MWKVRNADQFVEDFIISQTSGIIPRNDNKVVPVTYIACNVGVISNKQMIIDVRMYSIIFDLNILQTTNKFKMAAGLTRQRVRLLQLLRTLMI